VDGARPSAVDRPVWRGLHLRTARRRIGGGILRNVDVVDLDLRQSGSISVALLWHRRTNALSVFVYDSEDGESFELPVDAANALDAFRHPYAYASRLPAAGPVGRPARP
jgi:hypothetical protein